MRAGALALAAVFAALPVAADEPPVDARRENRARLAWILGDDDALRPSSTTTPVARGLAVGDRAGYGAFFDALAARDDGRESWVELGYARRAPAFASGVDTYAELAVAARLDAGLASGSDLELEDRGTRLGLRWGDPAVLEGELELFPLDSDAIRLGALHALDWGGTRAARAESSFPGAEPGVPAARARLRLSNVELFAAVKIGTPRDPADGAPLVGTLLGAAWDAAPGLRIRAGLGRIAHPSLRARGGPDERGFAAAANVRVVLHAGGLDDARAPGAFTVFRPEQPEPALTPGWALALESTGLVQRLADPDRPGESVVEPARALALQAELAGAGLDSAFALSVRELAFVLRNVPGLLPQRAVPRGGTAEPELGAAVSIGVTRFAPVAPELALGLRLPAAFSPGSAGAGAPPIIVRAAGDLAPLVPGSRRVPVLEARLGLACRLSSLLVLGGFVSYRRDNNVTALVRSGESVLLRRFAAPDFAGGGLMARAEF